MARPSGADRRLRIRARERPAERRRPGHRQRLFHPAAVRLRGPLVCQPRRPGKRQFAVRDHPHPEALGRRVPAAVPARSRVVGQAVCQLRQGHQESDLRRVVRRGVYRRESRAAAGAGAHGGCRRRADVRRPALGRAGDLLRQPLSGPGGVSFHELQRTRRTARFPQHRRVEGRGPGNSRQGCSARSAG